MQFIDLKSQYQQYKDSIDSSIYSVLNHGKYLMGPEIEKLEQELSDFVGVKHCVTVGSGTVSLEIALRALDIGPGDEVITVPFTWISTAEVIMAVKATPIFIDIELDSYNMNPDLLEAAINKNTKAIIPVSLFGQIPNIEKISSIAKKYNLPVIEDGAQSFGAERNGIKSCATTIIGSTSFFPAKVLGCYGDGGAIFTNNNKIFEKLISIRLHGKGIDKKVGKHIYVTGGAAVSLSESDSGSHIYIAGGTNGAAACNLPTCRGNDGLEFTFLLKAANGTGDFDIDAKDGLEFFIGSLVGVEAGDSVGLDFNGSSHDQLVLAASKGAAGDRIHITSAGGRWWIQGVTNDQNGWAVGTDSANT